MSQENLEIVRKGYEDPSPLTSAMRFAPDAEFDFTAVYPDQPVLRGVEEMRRFRDAGPWGRSIHFQPERYFDVDDECVLVFVSVTSTGQASGAAVESRVAQEFTIRDGLIVRVKVHRDRSEALQAVGLTGQAMARENVEIVRDFYEAFACQEFPVELVDREIEYINPVGAVEEGTRRGLAEFRRAVEKVLEGWATWAMEPEEFTAIGNQVAVVVAYRARGQASGLELEGRESALLTLRNGKIVRYAWFHGPSDALEAASSPE
jgi:ketosteroid isomerase-like protein